MASAGRFDEERGWEVEVGRASAELIREMTEKVANLAVEFAPVRTGFLRRSIEPEFTGSGLELEGYVIAKTDYAAAMELGSETHPIFSKIMITDPKTKKTRPKMLRFGDKKNPTFRRRVTHPGTDPRPYLRPALHAILRQYTRPS